MVPRRARIGDEIRDTCAMPLPLPPGDRADAGLHNAILHVWAAKDEAWSTRSCPVQWVEE